MVRIVNKNTYCFIGRFTDLIVKLSSIEDKSITLQEYLRLEEKKSIEHLN